MTDPKLIKQAEEQGFEDALCECYDFNTFDAEAEPELWEAYERGFDEYWRLPFSWGLEQMAHEAFNRRQNEHG